MRSPSQNFRLAVLAAIVLIAALLGVQSCNHYLPTRTGQQETNTTLQESPHAPTPRVVGHFAAAHPAVLTLPTGCRLNTTAPGVFRPRASIFAAYGLGLAKQCGVRHAPTLPVGRRISPEGSRA